MDGSRSERSRGESISEVDGDSIKKSKVKEYVRIKDISSTDDAVRDPNPQSSRMDAHIANQFPGQDPSLYTVPYKPALSPAGGFGLAADYYGDQGQSVAAQPGVRPSVPLVSGQPHLQSASAIANPPQETGHGAADDYYMSGALADPEPPKLPRPSQSSTMNSSSNRPGKYSKTSDSAQVAGAAAAGAAGAALGYTMSGGTVHSNNQGNGTHTANSNPAVGSQMPYQTSATFAAGGQHSQYDHSTSAPAIPTLGSTYAASSSAKPSVKPGKSSTHHSNLPTYAAAAGLAGAAAYEYHQHHHTNSRHSQHNSMSFGGSVPRPSPGIYGSSPAPYSQGGLGMQHRHQSPVSKLVDWWQDHEDVQKMEEYTEYIGVCRYCFDPRSNARDAPRKHHYNRRRSNDSLRGSRENLARRSTENLSRTGRVNKTSRYERYDYSSDEGRRKRNKSGNWIAAGLGAYGLGKLGKSFFGSGQDFEDTYSVRSGRYNESSTSLHRVNGHGHSHGRSVSHGNAAGRSEYGIIGSEHSHRGKEFVAHHPSHNHGHVEKQFVRHHSHPHSRSRSHSRERKSATLGAELGAAAGASVLSSSHHPHSRSSREEIRFEKRTSSPGRHPYYHEREKSPSMFSGFFGRSSPSPKRRGSRRHREKKKGFFTFSNSSSSSGGSDLVYGSKLDLATASQTHRRRSSPRRKASTSNLRKGGHDDINKTLLGIGATAAALGALNARDKRKSSVHDIYARPDGRTKIGKPSRRSKTSVAHAGHSGDVDSDAVWESASEAGDSESGASLAFGGSDIESHVVKPRKSTDSLASNESGMNILGWRFGGSGKRKRRSNLDLDRRYASDSFHAPGMANGPPPTTHYPPRSDIGSVMSSSSNLPAMQHVAPEPIQSYSESPALGVPDFGSPSHHRHSSIPVSPRHQIEDPIVVSRPDPMPLQQPQPVKPVSPPKYAAPTGAPVFARETSSSDVGRKSNLRRASRAKPTEEVTTGTSSDFMRDAALAGIAGMGVASVLSSKDGKKKDKTDTALGRDSPTSPQVRFDESRKHPERGNQQSRKDRDRQEREEQDMRDEVKRIEEERKEREQIRLRKRDEEIERKARERRDADLARSAEIRDREQKEREKKEREEAERVNTLRREAERQAELNRLRDLEIERERKKKETERKEREQELERQRELEQRREHERRYELERQRELERHHELERQRELERQQDLQRQQESERQRELERERERENERLREQEERDRESKRWRDAAMAGVAGATVGAVIAGVSHSGSDRDRDIGVSGEDSRDRKSKSKSKNKKKRAEERGASAPVTQEIAPTEEIIPSNDHTSPVLDDELMDRDYFNKSRAGNSIDAAIAPTHERDHYDPSHEHEEFMREFQDRYEKNGNSQSMAEFFSPPELHEPSTGKTAVAPAQFPEEEAFDPPAMDTTPAYGYPYTVAAAHEHDYHSPGAGAKSWIHHQIPELRIISATPPQSIKGDHSTAPSPVVEEKVTTQSEAGSKVSGRSVSWGEDQTHVYTAVTPQASYESLASTGESSARDAKVIEPSSKAPEPVKEYAIPDSLKQYVDDGASRVDKDDDEEGVEEVTTPGVVVDDDGSVPNVFSYHTPWAETASDLAGQMFNDSSTENLRHGDSGFVEGEVFGETPKEERMPGGFDDYEDFSGPGAHRELESRVEELPDTPKEEINRAEEEPEYFASKKDKKKKSKKRQSIEEAAAVAATAAAVPIAAQVASDIIKEKEANPEDEFERPLSKKEKKKREKEKKRMSVDDDSPTPRSEILEEDSAETAATAATTPAAEKSVEETQVEDFDRPLSKKEKKKKDKARKSLSLDEGSPTPTEELRSEFGRTMTAEPEGYEEVQSRAGAQTSQDPVVSIPTNAFDDLDELAGAKTPKSKTKRRSGQYSSPTARSPLRSEILYEDAKVVSEQKHGVDEASIQAAEDDLASSKELKKTSSRSSRESRGSDRDREPRDMERPSRESEFDDVDTRSRTSDQADNLSSRRKHRKSSSRYESPDGDTRSVAASEAASEPAYFYETTSSKKKSKHRSGREDDDDDIRSVVSTPAKWDDRDTKSSGKDKKGGLFGLFRSKSEEQTETKRSSRDSPTRSKYDDDDAGWEDGEKKKKKKKHRSSDRDDVESVTGRSEVSESRRSSKYDAELDDTRSTTSSSSKREKRRRSTGDNYDDKGKPIAFKT